MKFSKKKKNQRNSANIYFVHLKFKQGFGNIILFCMFVVVKNTFTMSIFATMDIPETQNTSKMYINDFKNIFCM